MANFIKEVAVKLKVSEDRVNAAIQTLWDLGQCYDNEEVVSKFIKGEKVRFSIYFLKHLRQRFFNLDRRAG
jgi:hypothetical protein